MKITGLGVYEPKVLCKTHALQHSTTRIFGYQPPTHDRTSNHSRDTRLPRPCLGNVPVVHTAQSCAEDTRGMLSDLTFSQLHRPTKRTRSLAYLPEYDTTQYDSVTPAGVK